MFVCVFLCSAGVHVCVTAVNFAASDAARPDIKRCAHLSLRRFYCRKTGALQLNQTAVSYKK